MCCSQAGAEEGQVLMKPGRRGKRLQCYSQAPGGGVRC